MSITAEDVVKLFEQDVKARKRLAELLVGEPDVRLAIINAVLRDVATKEDLRRMETAAREEFARMATKEELKDLGDRISKLEDRLSRVEERLSRVEGRLDVLVRSFFALNVPVLVAVIGILLKMVLAP